LLIYSGIAILVFLFVWFELDLLLLAFAGVLVAVILTTITGVIERHTRMSGMFAYAATLLLVGVILVAAGWLLAPRAITQISDVARSMPESIHRLEKPLEKSDWGRALLQHAHTMMHGTRLSSRIPEIADAVTGTVTDLIVVVVVGFFAALNPRGYSEGLLLLLPEERRDRAREIAGKMNRQLKWWLWGQMLPMTVLGLGSGLGLWLLHVHLPWTLGLITGVAIFLPYAGTVLAAIPSILMGLQRSPQTALYVLILYTLLHLAEGYILTPLVQKKAVRLPPVLTILTQYFMWGVGGILGLAVAAPLASAGIVLFKELYLHVPAEKEVVPEAPAEQRKSA
jgi:predicted PurR-regulated permease PerM